MAGGAEPEVVGGLSRAAESFVSRRTIVGTDWSAPQLTLTPMGLARPKKVKKRSRRKGYEVALELLERDATRYYRK